MMPESQRNIAREWAAQSFSGKLSKADKLTRIRNTREQSRKKFLKLGSNSHLRIFETRSQNTALPSQSPLGSIILTRWSCGAVKRNAVEFAPSAICDSIQN